MTDFFPSLSLYLNRRYNVTAIAVNEVRWRAITDKIDLKTQNSGFQNSNWC